MSEAALPVPRPRTGNSGVFALVTLAVVEFLVFGLALAMGARGTEVTMVLIALATIFVGVFPIVFDMARPAEQRQLFISLTTFVFMIFLVVPVFTQYFLLKGEFVPGRFRLSNALPSDIAHAQVVAFGGLLALLIGFYVPFGRFLVTIVPEPKRDWSPQAALVVSVVTLGLGWLIYIAGNLGFIPSRVGSGITGTLTNGSIFGISLLALTWLRHRRREALLLLIMVVPLAMIFNFFTGSKRMFLTPPFMIALAYMVYERRIRKSWAIAGFAALVALYPISNFYRAAVAVDDGSRTLAFLQNPGAVLAGMSQFAGTADIGQYIVDGLLATGARLDGLAVLATIVRDTPDRVPYQGGWTIGLMLLVFIPRLIWPDKPQATIGEWVSQTYGSPYDLSTDVGPTWMGELFFNWGYPGVVVGMFVIGIFCRMLQERLFQWNAPIPALMGAIGVLYFVTRSPQAGLLAPVMGTIFTILPIVAAHVLVGLFGGYQRVAPRASGSPAAVLPAGT